MREQTLKFKYSGDSEKELPVPMPNTEVKLLSADSSWWETACEGRTLLFLFFYSGLAQLVERLTVNQDVVSSSLTTGVDGTSRSCIKLSTWRAVREAEGA